MPRRHVSGRFGVEVTGQHEGAPRNRPRYSDDQVGAGLFDPDRSHTGDPELGQLVPHETRDRSFVTRRVGARCANELLGEAELVGRIKLLTPLAQRAGAALVLDGNVDLVGRSGADGAHLTGIHALEGAIERLKPDRIAGAGGMVTRHDAMLAAEADADYVLFGEPDLNGERPSLSAIENRVSWWAEVFQPPCVAYATSLEDVAALAAAGMSR